MRKQSSKESQTTESTSEQAQKNYNPFIDTVNEKPYSQINVEVGQERMYNPIPEPTFGGDTISASEDAYSMINDDSDSGGGSNNGGHSSVGQSIGKQSIPLSDADKKQGATQLAKIIVDTYEQGHHLVNNWMQISPKRLRKMQAEGKIDLSVQIPYEYGKTMSAGELIEEINNQNKDLITVSKEFKKEVTPILADVLAEEGVGLTKKQTLIYLFGKDIAIKSVQVFQAKSAINDLFDVIAEYTDAVKSGADAPTQSQSAPQKTDAGFVARPTVVDQSVDYNSEDFNFATNETVVESTVQKHSVPETGKSRLMAQRKREKEIETAMKKAESLTKPKVSVSYQDAIQSKKTGKRGRKPKDYIKAVSEDEIADAIVLTETPKADENPLSELE